jgi:Spy/CpxP family protein refolding chaperone
MVSAKRLSKIIQETLSKKVESNLLKLYECLTPEQRSIIREDMERIKKCQ